MSYAGDDVGAVVGDVGSLHARFGFAGENAPLVSISSVVGVRAEDGSAAAGGGDGGGEAAVAAASRFLIGDTALSRPVPGLELRHVAKEEDDMDWEVLEALWEYGVSDRMRTRMELHPVVAVELPNVPLSRREKYVEMMFESFKVPALYLARSPVTSAFAAGRSTALVVDMGASSTRVSPVYDGFVLTKAVRSTPIGGRFMEDMMMRSIEMGGTALKPLSEKQVAARAEQAKIDAQRIKAIQSVQGGGIVHQGRPPAKPSDEDDGKKKRKMKPRSAGAAIIPRYAFTRKRFADSTLSITSRKLEGVTASFADFHKRAVARDAIAGLCAVRPKKGDAPRTATRYELPDGTKLEMEEEGLELPELIFDMTRCRDEFLPALEARAARDRSLKLSGLPDLIHRSLLNCDADIRRELCENIILTGGGSLIPGLPERLHADMCLRIPSAFKIKLLLPSRQQRLFSSWTGGSILASLGSFQQLWLSAKEYEEEGPGIVERRCP